MIERIEFDIKIESANRRISPNRVLERFYMSGKYRSAKQLLTMHFGTEFKLRNIEGCNIEIGFSKEQWRGDLDNGTKVVLDALEKSGVIMNDKNVKRLLLIRLDSGAKKSYVKISFCDKKESE